MASPGLSLDTVRVLASGVRALTPELYTHLPYAPATHLGVIQNLESRWLKSLQSHCWWQVEALF